MATVTWTITDAAESVDLHDWSVGPNDVAGAPDGWSVTKRRLVGGKRDGVSLIEIDNGNLRIAVIPTRGMGVWKCWRGDRTLGWNSPVNGPVHPNYVPVSEPSGLGWLEGFDEMIARCGLINNGAPEFDDAGTLRFPLHGRIANLPAHRVTVTVDAEAGTISVTGVVDETRFLFHSLRLTATVTTSFGADGFSVHDEVTNLTEKPAELQMLYHVNVGLPILSEGATLITPAKTVVSRNARAAEGLAQWDIYPGPEAGFEEQCYFLDMATEDSGDTRVLLKAAGGEEAVELGFNKTQLPYFTLWKHTAAHVDGYVTGIEPGTNLSNPRSFEGEQGRFIALPPHGRHIMELAINWHADVAAIQEAEESIAALLSDTKPRLIGHHEAGWSADF